MIKQILLPLFIFGGFHEARFNGGNDALRVRAQGMSVDIVRLGLLQFFLGVDDFVPRVVRVAEAVVRTVRLLGQRLVGGCQERRIFYDSPVAGQ